MSASVTFERAAEYYDATRRLPDAVSEQVAEGLARIFSRAGADPSPHVLEVGIGTGRIAVPLAARGVRLSGVDLAAPMLAKLREKTAAIGAVRADATQLPFPPARFDGALFVHVLHLVPEPDRVVNAAVAAVRAGGIVATGGDDRGAEIWQEAIACFCRAAREVAGVELRTWERHDDATSQAQRALESAGARCETVTLARWSARLTARKLLDGFAARINSASWDVPEEAMPAVVARIEPELDRLAGGLDREHENPRSFSVLVGTLPG